MRIYNSLSLSKFALTRLLCKKTGKRIEKIQVFQSNPYFEELGEEILSEINLGIRLYQFERDEVLFWEGDECAGLHMIR
jgi:hypothetical protein